MYIRQKFNYFKFSVPLKIYRSCNPNNLTNREKSRWNFGLLSSGTKCRKIRNTFFVSILVSRPRSDKEMFLSLKVWNWALAKNLSRSYWALYCLSSPRVNRRSWEKIAQNVVQPNFLSNLKQAFYRGRK
jgi:hypothetical protein